MSVPGSDARKHVQLGRPLWARCPHSKFHGERPERKVLRSFAGVLNGTCTTTNWFPNGQIDPDSPRPRCGQFETGVTYNRLQNKFAQRGRPRGGLELRALRSVYPRPVIGNTVSAGRYMAITSASVHPPLTTCGRWPGQLYCEHWTALSSQQHIKHRRVVGRSVLDHRSTRPVAVLTRIEIAHCRHCSDRDSDQSIRYLSRSICAACASAESLASATLSELSGLSAKVANPQSGVISKRSAPNR